MTRRTILLLLTLVILYNPQPARATALDDYIAAPDASYSYSLVATINEAGYDAYVIDMTSQSWRSPVEVSPQLWQHYVTLIVPHTLLDSRALLMIDKGNIGDPAPTTARSDLAQLATSTGSVMVNLQMVPNQPLLFAGEIAPRPANTLIAKTFRLFFDTGDNNWPALLPMTKSVVRAMDTAESFLSGQGVTISGYVVTGGSKRGWTSWLAAAVDNRVVAIMPVVYDGLNLEPLLAHQKQAYQGVTELMVGGYSFALESWVVEGIPDEMGTPAADTLLGIVDPYTYLSRMTSLPKYIVNAVGDEFFALDSAQFYFHDLPGSANFLRYLPNVGHGYGGQAFAATSSFYQAFLAGVSPPDFSWTLQPDGSIQVDTVNPPSQVNLWQASNPASRDFRHVTFGAGWSSTPLFDQGGGVYQAVVPHPANGATAFMVELIYGGGATAVSFTTEVRVLEAVSVAVPLLQPGGLLLLAAGLLLSGMLALRWWAPRHQGPVLIRRR